MSELIRRALIVSAVAFVLHYAWENAQCRLFFVHLGAPGTQAAMVRATLGDVALTWLDYVAVALAGRDAAWAFGRWRSVHWLAMLAVAAGMAVAVERFALASGRWAYTPIAPIIPGTSVSIVPVAQLLLLFPLTFAIARRLDVGRPRAHR